MKTNEHPDQCLIVCAADRFEACGFIDHVDQLLSHRWSVSVCSGSRAAVRMQSTTNYLWLISDLLGQGATANVYRGRHKVRTHTRLTWAAQVRWLAAELFFLGENLKQTLVILPRKCFCWSSLTVNSVRRGWIRTDPTSFWRVNSDSLHKESQLSIRCLLLKESVSSDQSEQSINRYQDCFCPVKRPQRKHLWFLSWASTSITDDWKHWFCWLMGAKRSVLRTLFLIFTSVNWDFISKIFSSDLTSHFVYSRSKKSLQASNCTDRGFPQTFDVNL